MFCRFYRVFCFFKVKCKPDVTLREALDKGMRTRGLAPETCLICNFQTRWVLTLCTYTTCDLIIYQFVKHWPTVQLKCKLTFLTWNLILVTQKFWDWGLELWMFSFNFRTNVLRILMSGYKEYSLILECRT